MASISGLDDVVLDLLKSDERLLRLNGFFGIKWNNQCIKNKNDFDVMLTMI